jgi:hypothetical protein
MKSQLLRTILIATNAVGCLLWFLTWYRNLSISQIVVTLMILVVLLLFVAFDLLCGFSLIDKSGAVRMIYKVIGIVMVFPISVLEFVIWMLVKCSSYFCSRVNWKYGLMMSSTLMLGISTLLLTNSIKGNRYIKIK